jgi:hypothetical protein
VFDAIYKSFQSAESKMVVVVKVDGLAVVGEAERRLVYEELPAPKESSPGGLAPSYQRRHLCFHSYSPNPWYYLEIFLYPSTVSIICACLNPKLCAVVDLI